MNIPLEVRHQIFEYVTIRDAQPKKLLRYWFEKKEVKEKIAELAAQTPNASAPQVVYEGDQFEHEEHEEDGSGDDEDGEEDGDSDGDSDEEDENEEDSDEEDEEENSDEEGGGEEELDEDEDETEEQDAEMDEAGSTTVRMAATPAVPANAQGQTISTPTSTTPTAHDQKDSTTTDQDIASAIAGRSLTDAQYNLAAAMAGAHASSTVAAQATTALATPAVVQAPGQGNTGGQDADTDMADESEEDHDAKDGTPEEGDAEVDGGDEIEDADDTDGDSGEEVAEEGDDVETAAQPPAPAPVITAHRKWRHIPQVRVKELRR